MRYLSHTPAPSLGAFVENLWLLEDAPAHAEERIIPSGTIELVVNLRHDEIRVSRDGYLARTPDFDLVVAMNPETYARDIAEVRSGGWLLYDSSWPLDA